MSDGANKGHGLMRVALGVVLMALVLFLVRLTKDAVKETRAGETKSERVEPAEVKATKLFKRTVQPGSGAGRPYTCEVHRVVTDGKVILVNTRGGLLLLGDAPKPEPGAKE